MQTNKYYRFVFVICITIFAVVSALSWVVFFTGPRVRAIDFDKNMSQRSYLKGSNITIKFDRAIKQEDYSKLIKFEPELQFESQTQNQEIIIGIQNNPNLAQTYKLTLESDVYDTSGRKMSQPYVYEFITAQPTYAYLERNYQYDSITEQSELDTIYSKTPDTQPKILYQAPEIYKFAINDRYLVLSERGEAYDNLVIVDLVNKQVQKLDQSLSGHVDNLLLSPNGNQAIYNIVFELGQFDSETYNSYTNRIYSIDLNTQQITQMTKKPDIAFQVNDVFLSNNGQLILVNEVSTNNYYIASSFNDIDPVFIGSFDGSFGFTHDDKQIVFTDRGVTSYYNLENSDLSENLDGKKDIRIINLNGPLIFTGQQAYEFSRITSSQIASTESLDNTKTNLVWRETDGQSLVNISASYDSNYVAAEYAPSPCQYDDYKQAEKCPEAETKVIDIRNNQIIDEFLGINFTWIP